MEKQLAFFNDNGYLVIPDALSADEVQAINDAIDHDLVENQVLWPDRGNGRLQTVHILLACPELDVTMRPPTLLPLMEAIMGQNLCAEEHSAMIRSPNPDGPTECHWHRDATGHSRGILDDPPYLSVVFYLTDVDDTTHTFSVIPGSHTPKELPPPDAYDLSTAHHIVGDAGTAIFFNTATLHAGNVRNTTKERRTIHIYCGRTTDPYLSNHTIFPRRLWEGKDEATLKYYSRPNPMTRLLMEQF